MPLDFVGFYIQNTIDNTIVASRKHLMNLVEKYPYYIYVRLNKNLKMDSDILNSIFLKRNDNISLLKYIPIELSKDKHFLLQLITKNEQSLGLLDEELLNDFSFLKDVIFANSKSIPYLYYQFQVIYNQYKAEFDDKESIFLQAYRKQEYEIAGKHKGLVDFLKLHRKGDVKKSTIKKIELEIQNVKPLNYNINFIFNRAEFLNSNEKEQEKEDSFYMSNAKYETIIYFPELYTNDKEVAIKLLDESKFSLSIDNTTEYILTRLSDALRNDQDIARQELSKDGLMLEYFSDSIKNNPDLVKIAIDNNVESYFLAGQELKKYKANSVNKELLLKVINKNSNIILHVDEEWRKDEDVISVIKSTRPILLELIKK